MTRLSKKRDEQIRAMLLAVIGEADYDLAKSFDPDLSEDPEHSERTMVAMVRIVRDRLPGMIASERVKALEYWEVHDGERIWGGNFASKKEAAHFRQQCGALLEDAKLVHVTRWRVEVKR